MRFTVAFLVCGWSAQAIGAVEVRLRDCAHIQGLRENAVIGYGLVVGLQGTGDSRNSIVTLRSMANMLEKFGMDMTQKDFAAKNSAAVMVTATLMPFVRSGDKLDVSISSMGDAKSLQGGTLMMTALYAGNHQIYATAQGPVSVGGYYVGQSSQSIQKNVTTGGIISNGGIVEKAVDSEFLKDNKFTLTLARTDFVLANQVLKRIEGQYGANVAQTLNGTEIVITLPGEYQAKPAAFIADLLNLSVPQENDARVVIDERTGTVVIGGDVRISKVAVSHGSLHIAIAGETKVSQPLPFTMGQTVVAEQLSIRGDEAKGKLVVLPEGTSIEELVRALNALGTLPRDIIVILSNLKAVGALHGTIITR
jgi:flagellar P-ring protein precursor FlgI